MYPKLLLSSVAVVLMFSAAQAQTASSLFYRSDSLQVSEIKSEQTDMSEIVGHCGPAVENSHMVLRIVFDEKCPIDLYSKTGRGMELLKYKWYPTNKEQSENGAGGDIYNAGEFIGFGGIALWDGEKIVSLAATKGKTARVGDSSKGSFAEMESCGVICGNDTLDILVRVETYAKKREAKVIAKELSGKKVRFVTGLGYGDRQKVVTGENFAFVWGPSQVSDSLKTVPVGTGIRFSAGKFGKIEKKDNILMMVSEPCSSISTTLVGTSSMEAELNSLKRFESYMMK